MRNCTTLLITTKEIKKLINTLIFPVLNTLPQEQFRNFSASDSESESEPVISNPNISSNRNFPDRLLFSDCKKNYFKIYN